MIRTGLDRLLDAPAVLSGRRFGLLAHAAAVSSELVPAHLALSAAGAPPARLLGPEHGYYGAEQDMVASADARDPWTGVPIVSLYGDSPESLRPADEVFAGLDLLVVDLQDVGARYYTYAASAVWAARAALAAGCEVWVLDRPNPLGGSAVEGNLRAPELASFVGAFEHPVRHGLTLGELVRLETGGADGAEGLSIWTMEGWRRDRLWRDLERPWMAPSPNIPTPETALVYPGLCLLEGTELSEGRGTTRPFELAGGPGVDPLGLADRLARAEVPGVRFVPAYFRPQFQKHADRLCGGVQIVVTDPAAFPSFRCGVEVLTALRHAAPESFAWRRRPYEFVSDRPAIDLLAGDTRLRRALDDGSEPSEWVAGWREDERAFRRRRRAALLYPEVEGS